MNKKVKKKVKKDNNKINKKFSFKLLIGFIVFQLFFTCITAPFVLLYGPFENAKSMFVGTAMSSMHYQWLATTFLSDSQINKILGKSEVDDDDDVSTDDSNLINIPKVQDDSIKYATLENNDTFSGHVLIISDPTRIKIGYTSKLDAAKKEGETTSTIAMNNNAVAAVNGGAFTDEADSQEWTANGGTPSGVIISGGKVVYDDTAGDEKGTIAMTKQGRLTVGRFTTNELLEKGITEAVSFETNILVSGGKALNVGSEGGSSPRTLIGQRQNGSIVLVVLDSKKDNRIAATLKEAQEVMIKLECVTAATLDGGKSATMYYNDEVVNTPSYAYGERYIPTAVIVK